MSQLIIRNIVRNILLETRGPLAFIPILKEWIKVAAKYGDPVDLNIKGPAGRPRAENASLKVPPEHAHEVFDNSSKDLQEYILKHWRSEEYFSAMIEGVTLGIIKSYEKSNYMGMKSGSTSIQGAINYEGEMVGSMDGYLTAKMESSYGWRATVPRPNRPCIYNQKGQMNTDTWEEMLTRELRKGSGSTMVHEFQHWFQESVMYSQTGQMKPTKRRGGSNALPKTRETNPNFMELQPIQLMLAKKMFSGVDWNTTMKIRGATAYKLNDPEAFFKSYNPLKDKNQYEYANTLFNVYNNLNLQEARDLIEVILYDYLKLQKHLDSDDLDTLAKEATEGKWFNLRSRAQGMMWDKGHEINTFIHHQNSYGVTDHKEKVSKYNKNTRDTPKGSGEKTVQGTDSLFKSLGSTIVDIKIFKKTDFDKKGNLKQGRQPRKPTPLVDINRTAAWVILSRGTQKVPRRKSDAPEWDFENKRGTRTSGWGRGEWTERWVEFDAVVSEYIVAEVQSMLRNHKAVLVYLVKGDAKNFARHLRQMIEAKVGARGFDHARKKDVNRKHIESLAERITDRLIETVEENPYEDYYDLNPNNSDKKNQMAILTPQRFDNWVNGKWQDAPYGTVDYWEWIFAKASGENV